MQGSELREAPRFPSALPVITEAGKGITRDFSGSGVFFEANGSFSPGQPIEFSFVLEHLYPERPVCLKCKGSIVRVEKNGQKTGVASTIDSYTIEDHHP